MKFQRYFIVLIIEYFSFNVKVGATFDEQEEEFFNSFPSLNSVGEILQDSPFETPDEKWISIAIEDIAYFLRNFKFNEWDRRINLGNNASSTGFYKAFPMPALSSLHWKVRDNCDESFLKCIVYLHSVIENAPLTRDQDTVSILNRKSVPLTGGVIEKLENECRKALSVLMHSSLPFDSSIDKFQWTTTAAYYMCWYTMLGTPALSMLGEPCDNFASCLDFEFGIHNQDPRADNKFSFSCATYSFCPDTCCPSKHVSLIKDCIFHDGNPCFQGEFHDNVCKLNRKENQNLKDIVANRWNITCKCQEPGFIWKSRYGMCVDYNECSEENACDPVTQGCLNLPGTYTCVCKWGYKYDITSNRCVKD